MAERHSLLRLSVTPTTWVLSDKIIGEICFTIRDCATEQPISLCIPTEVPVGPSLPLSCLQVLNSTLTLNTSEPYSILISHGYVPNASPPLCLQSDEQG